MSESVTQFWLDDGLKKDVKIRATIENVTFKKAIHSALYDWLDKFESREAASIAAGTGVIGRFRKDPEKFKQALKDLPAEDPIESGNFIIKP